MANSTDIQALQWQLSFWMDEPDSFAMKMGAVRPCETLEHSFIMRHRNLKEDH